MSLIMKGTIENSCLTKNLENLKRKQRLKMSNVLILRVRITVMMIKWMRIVITQLHLGQVQIKFRPIRKDNLISIFREKKELRFQIFRIPRKITQKTHCQLIVMSLISRVLIMQRLIEIIHMVKKAIGQYVMKTNDS